MCYTADMTSDTDAHAVPPPKSLQSVIGAILFAAESPLTVADLRDTLKRAAEGANQDSDAARYAAVSAARLHDLLDDIGATLGRLDLGIALCEDNGAFSLRTQPGTGAWVRAAVKAPPPQRLSRPALETLAIIAYRQPISRAEIESVRGVSAEHVLRALTELSLIRTVGRSDLPGRPFLYGTTATFLEHFGLRSLETLTRPAGEESDTPRTPMPDLLPFADD